MTPKSLAAVADDAEHMSLVAIGIDGAPDGLSVDGQCAVAAAMGLVPRPQGGVELGRVDADQQAADALQRRCREHQERQPYRVAACMRMLESLEEYGVLTLPAKRNTTPGPRTPITCTGRSDPRPEINCALAELEPLSLQSATEERDIADWNELVDRHHGLGCPRPFGPHLRWFVMDRDGRCLGCLLFEAAAKSLPARDAWIGWSEKDRDRRLHLAVSNSRFLILPWVRVDNLASRALSMAARHLSGEWQERHGCRPVLCETFVDPTRFDGTCYRAANWTVIGMTAGRRSGRRAKPPKQILVLPLEPGFRAVLKGENRTPQRRKPPAPARDDPYVAMWMKIIDAAGEHAQGQRVRARHHPRRHGQIYAGRSLRPLPRKVGG